METKNEMDALKREGKKPNQKRQHLNEIKEKKRSKNESRELAKGKYQKFEIQKKYGLHKRAPKEENVVHSNEFYT